MLHRTDDHYNQARYRLERTTCIISERQPGQRVNYPYLFEMKAAPKFIPAWCKEHKNYWFIGGAATCLKY